MKTFFKSSSKIILSFILIFALIDSDHLMAQKQEMPEDLYYEIACFKFKKAGAMDFFISKGKKINQEMINRGIIDSWSFYRVDFPNGSDCECNYRAVRVFRGIATLDKLKDRSIRDNIIRNIWPNKTSKDISSEFNELIDFRYSHIFNMRDALVPKPTHSAIMVVNFMDVEAPNRTTYVQMEKEIFKPLHASNLDAGNMVDWVLASRVMPHGSEVEVDFITIDKYDSYDKMNRGDFNSSFKTVHPTLESQSTMNKMGKMRTLTRSEVWQTIEI